MRQQHLLQGEPTILGGASSKHDSCHSRFIFVVVLVWGVSRLNEVVVVEEPKNKKRRTDEPSTAKAPEAVPAKRLQETKKAMASNEGE